MKEIGLDIFPNVSKDDWIGLAKKQLKGDDPLQALSWVSESQIQLNSYYDQSDIEGLSSQVEFFRSLKPFSWKLYENVIVTDEASANKEAIESLTGGCDGIVFDVNEEIAFQILLENVLIDICDVSIRSSSELTKIPDDLNGFILSSNNSNAISSKQENQVTAIAEMLDSISDEQHILRNASTDFFLEIASIRALRFLLHERFGEVSNQIQIHTSIYPHENENQQWFVNSTAGLASILGGTNSISFHTSKGSSRISRNVGNIIREECGISQYQDQCGGSFYVEVLTNKIILECKKNLTS